MSKETREWLSQNVLVGYTDELGNAWHWREGDDNHFAKEVPLLRVQSLFGFEILDSPVLFRNKNGEIVEADNRKLYFRSDTDTELGIHTAGHAGHGYDEWLLKLSSNLIGDTLKVQSAGLLSKGAVAWVQMQVPETVDTPSGYSFRPTLLAATSFNGTLQTTYKRTIQAVVCDNILSGALAGEGVVVKVKHTKNSEARIPELRETLELMDVTAQSFSDVIAELSSVTVTDKQWSQFLDEIVPLPEAGDSTAAKRAMTMSENKREALTELWNADPRVSPWRGTLLGGVQAVNTYNQHLSVVRKDAARAERHQMNVIRGKVDATDSETLAVFNKVLSNA